MSSNVRVAEVRYLVLSSGAVVRSGLVQLGAYTVRSLPLPLTTDMGQFYFCTVFYFVFSHVSPSHVAAPVSTLLVWRVAGSRVIGHQVTFPVFQTPPAWVRTIL